MANSIIKYAKGVITLFAVCAIGTATAAPNGNGNEKEKREVKAEKAVQSTQWFEFIGTSSDSPTDHTKYRALEEGEPLPDCPSGNQVCILNAPMGSNNEPDIDSNLQTEINNATSSGVESANVKLRQ